MRDNLDAVFSPKSIAVIGASRKKYGVGREILHNLILGGFNGRIYPVNPNATDVHSIKAYPSVMDIPDEVDLGIVVVPAEKALKVVEECGKKGVKGLVVITAGFREIGGEGLEREKKLRELINQYGMRMIGPNCMGIINTDPDVNMDATFAPTMPLKGNIGLISHSGALGAAILDHAENIKVGFSKFASLGNRTDVSSNDLLMMMEDDPQTDVVLMYIESFGNPRNFTKIVRRITRKMPVIALKSGRTEAGSRAALSHTGALAGLDVATDALFEQCGVIRVQSIEELFDYGSAFSMQPLPKGKKVAILTNAGGPGIMAVDACVYFGLEVSKLSKTTVKVLEEHLPREASKSNPIDMIADAGAKRYEVALEALLKDENVDAAIVINVPPVMIDEHEIAKAIVSVSKKYDKPVLTCFLARGESSPGFMELVGNSIPSYLFPENAVKSLHAMVRYKEYREREKGEVRAFDVDKNKVKEILGKVKSEGRDRLWDDETYEVLGAYGFPVARFERADNLEDAVKAAARIGYPVVLKVISRDVVHKTDFGAVVLNIGNEIELRGQFSKLRGEMKARKVKIDGLLIQEMVGKGKEVIMGMNLDPKFGPILMFGLGGVYAEVLKDVSFRLVPLTDFDSMRMIKSIKSYSLLEGVRGEEPSDIDSVAEMLQRLAQLVTDFLEIKELDINPLLVFEKGQSSRVVDARIILG
ncbi:MAG: acetate--CoA ligase family protein [Thermoplasmata archaeon]|nr:acetate--CoA ligase family protein [Thermoplasmata archaeon]